MPKRRLPWLVLKVMPLISSLDSAQVSRTKTHISSWGPGGASASTLLSGNSQRLFSQDETKHRLGWRQESYPRVVTPPLQDAAVEFFLSPLFSPFPVLISRRRQAKAQRLDGWPWATSSPPGSMRNKPRPGGLLDTLKTPPFLGKQKPIIQTAWAYSL